MKLSQNGRRQLEFYKNRVRPGAHSEYTCGENHGFLEQADVFHLGLYPHPCCEWSTRYISLQNNLLP